MMKISRGALAAIAAVVAIPTSIAIARGYDHGGRHHMSQDARERLDEGRLAMAKTALKLTAEQEPLWAAVEKEVREGFKAREARSAEREKMREERRKAREADKDDDKDGAKARADLGERIEKASERMTERAERMKAFVGAFKPFYASLSNEQKDVLRPLMRDLMRGERGHGGKHWGHRGGHGSKHWGQHDGRKHDRFDNRRADRGNMDDDKDTAIDQAAPDDDESPADKL